MEKPEQKTRTAQHPPTRIIVERVYLGGQSMEDAFRKINEETVKKNIEEMAKKFSKKFEKILVAIGEKI